MANLINENDSLNQGRGKLNTAIAQSEEALNKSITAMGTADEALSNSESTQDQLNQVVIDGDSSVEAAQARVNSDDTVTYTTLKERLDAEHDEVTSSLADIPNQTYITEKASVSFVNEQIESVTNGTPEAFASLAEIQNAYPSGDNYVKLNTADGYVYKWNGANWEQGWVYQSNVWLNALTTQDAIWSVI